MSRRDLSSLALAASATAVAAGYALAFTRPGALLVFAGWALAAIGVVLAPTWRRATIGAGTAALFLS